MRKTRYAKVLEAGSAFAAVEVIKNMDDRLPNILADKAAIPAAMRRRLLAFQRNEITEHHVYRHEHTLIEMLDDDSLKYMGSMVLALNNSIQEFSGIAAGLNFAMSATAQTIGVTVLISGLAATLAMSASEYLSQKAEAAQAGDSRRSLRKAVLYAGGIYLFIVLTIVAPYLLLHNVHAALALALCGVALILTVFTFFMAVVKGLRYRSVLLEALGVALAVVAASFLIGTLARRALHNTAVP